MWETRSVFHISMPRLLRQDCLRCRRPIAQRRMWPYRVVLHSPLLDHHLRLLQRVEDLPVQAFIPQLPIEALAIAVLPWTDWFDVQRLRSHGRQPLPQLQCHKLRPIIGTYVLGHSVLQHHVRQRFDQIVTVQPSCDPQWQTPPGILVEPNTLGAIHAGRLLLWLRLGSSLDRLGLYFGLYLSGGAHLADGRLAGHSGSRLYAIDLSFLFGGPINLFHLLLSCVPSSKQLARTIARRGSGVNNKSWRE